MDGVRGADDGSVLLLTIGYALLAIALVLVCVDATSLYLAQKRTDAAADAVAISAADGFRLTMVDGRPVARLSNDEGWTRRRKWRTRWERCASSQPTRTTVPPRG